MKNHNYKTITEVITAMMGGQTFHYSERLIYFDITKNNPFRCDNDPLRTYWNDWEIWQVKSHWTDNISIDNPVICYVENNDTCGIDKIIGREDNRFINVHGRKLWIKATPVKPEECWQGDE